MKYLILIPIVCFSQTLMLLAAKPQTFTSLKDFQQGKLEGITGNVINGQLQLSNKPSPIPPYIWVPNSQEGTLSKIDALTGKELARYRTGPEKITEKYNRLMPNVITPANTIPNLPSTPGAIQDPVTHYPAATEDFYPQPASTAIDLNGDVWVANRGYGLITKFSNDHAIDRNNNGIIETSSDRNNNGRIDPDEILPWNQDEKLLLTTRVGTIYSQPQPICVDPFNRIWVGLYNESQLIVLDGNTGQKIHTVNVDGLPTHMAIDFDGILWANLGSLLTKINIYSGQEIDFFDFEGQGLAVDPNFVWLTDHNDEGVMKIDKQTGDLINFFHNPAASKTFAITLHDDHIWATNVESNNVSVFHQETGEVLATIPVGQQPIAIDIDHEHNIWVLNRMSNNVTKINSETLQTSFHPTGLFSHNFGSMSAYNAYNVMSKKGLWTMTYDSKTPLTPWQNISWTSEQPNGTAFYMHVRSGNTLDQLQNTGWTKVNNHSLLNNIPPGQYLQLQANFFSANRFRSPILYDVAIQAQPDWLIEKYKSKQIASNQNDTVENRSPLLTIDRWKIPEDVSPGSYVIGKLFGTTTQNLDEYQFELFSYWQPKNSIPIRLVESDDPEQMEAWYLFQVPDENMGNKFRLIISKNKPGNRQARNNYYGKENSSNLTAWAEVEFSLNPLKAPHKNSNQLPANLEQKEYANLLWLTNPTEAKKLAQLLNRPIAILFYSENLRFESKLISTLQMSSRSINNFVPLFINIDQSSELAKSYNIVNAPFMVFTTHDNKLLQRIKGYSTPPQMKATMSNAINNFRNNKTIVTK